MRRRRNTQGAILAIAMIASLGAAVFAYTMLALAVSQGRQARFFRNRTRARYAAEAGMVRAQATLRRDSFTFCANPTTIQIDTNASGGIDAADQSVEITVTPEGCPHTGNVTIAARVRD